MNQCNLQVVKHKDYRIHTVQRPLSRWKFWLYATKPGNHKPILETDFDFHTPEGALFYAQLLADQHEHTGMING